MSEPAPEKRPRRPRYPGRNPRQFHERYKEHQPEKYAEEVEHILASGRTPAGTHRPIMVAEILKVLALKPGEIAVDCTLGYGGHAKELLAAVQPGGRLIGVDVDPLELPRTEARLRSLGFPDESLIVRRMNYAGVISSILAESPRGADAILADLGLSSMQIDDPARGFSFKTDGPLDMRLNPRHGEPVSQLLTKVDKAELAQILEENADVRHAAKLATAILNAHGNSPLSTTNDLAKVVKHFWIDNEAFAADQANESVRGVFQALRIAVNDEFGALETFLRQLPACLKPGGRVAMLSFHSGEDRRVKQAFKTGFRDGTYCSVSDEIIRPTPEEQRNNPRSSSAKLRFAVRGPA